MLRYSCPAGRQAQVLDQEYQEHVMAQAPGWVRGVVVMAKLGSLTC